jgi:hypothetical protein
MKMGYQYVEASQESQVDWLYSWCLVPLCQRINLLNSPASGTVSSVRRQTEDYAIALCGISFRKKVLAYQGMNCKFFCT